MQRRDSAFVERVWVGTGFNQTLYGLSLRRRIPVIRAGHARRSSVKRLSSPAIFGANVGTRGE